MDLTRYELDLARKRAVLEGDDELMMVAGADAGSTSSTTDQIANVLKALGPAAAVVQQLATGKKAEPAKPPEVKKIGPKPSWFAQHPYATVGIGLAGAGLLSLIVWGLARRPARR